MTATLSSSGIRMGDVYIMRFDGTGNEQGGLRPGLVFQNNTGNAHSPNVIALPLTSAVKGLHLPTHVFLPASSTCLQKDSVVLCENPQRMSKERLGKYIGRLPPCFMKQVAEASLLATGAISYLDLDTLVSVWQKAMRLNSVA